MLVDYDLMPESSRVWIYQSDGPIEGEKLELVKNRIESFIQTWKRHGEDLKASYLLKYNHFIILLVDEDFNDVSGCSIDASVNMLRQVEKELAMDLTNKLNVSFKDNDNINIVNLSEFKKYASSRKITADTVVFNNLVTTKKGFESNWEVKATKSWHSRFLVS